MHIEHTIAITKDKSSDSSEEVDYAETAKTWTSASTVSIKVSRKFILNIPRRVTLGGTCTMTLPGSVKDAI